MYWLAQIALIVAILILIAIPMWLWESRAKRKKLEETFADRQPLDERTFYERYFQARGVPFFVVSKVREILEEELDADLSRLSAEDDFKKNLSFFWRYDSMADVEIVVRLEKEFDIKITDAEAEKTNRVEDLVNLVWFKLQQRAA
jgi:acyl carrier protein